MAKICNVVVMSVRWSPRLSSVPTLANMSYPHFSPLLHLHLLRTITFLSDHLLFPISGFLRFSFVPSFLFHYKLARHLSFTKLPSFHPYYLTFFIKLTSTISLIIPSSKGLIGASTSYLIPLTTHHVGIGHCARERTREDSLD